MMQIHFFEEFPSRTTLAKAAWIDFSPLVYLGAPSWEAYQEAASLLTSINPRCRPAWWPILPRSYWISPFSFPDELEALFRRFLPPLLGEKLPLLLDLELPLLQRSLFRRNFRHFQDNKKRIAAFFSQAPELGLEIKTAEYPSLGPWSRRLWEGLGISYPCERYPHHKILMWYTSMIPPRLLPLTKRAIVEMRRHYGEALQIGLGTIAPGIFGTEPILPPHALERDLQWLAENAIREVVIFRLHGLEEPYLRVLQRYQARIL